MMHWYWISFSDDTKPKGQRALGCVIMLAKDTDEAIRAAHRRGLNPGGEALCAQIEDEWGAPPVRFIGRLLNRQQAEELAKEWDPGHRGLASPADIAKAFSDDDAKEGEPLFKPGVE